MLLIHLFISLMDEPGLFTLALSTANNVQRLSYCLQLTISQTQTSFFVAFTQNAAINTFIQFPNTFIGYAAKK